MSNSVTPWTVAHHTPLSMGFSGKNTGVGSHFLLQRIFPNQGLKLGQILYHLNHLGSPKALTVWTTANCGIFLKRWEYQSLTISWETCMRVKIGKGVRQGCILPPCLFNLFAECMQNAGLDDSQAGIKIARRNINNIRYVDDTTLMAESKEDLNSLLSSQITADSDWSHEIKRHLLLGRKAMTNLDSLLKSKDITLRTKFLIVKAMVFPAVMYGCESWALKKAEHQRIGAFELWCWGRFWLPWTARRSNQSILKEVNPEYSLEGLRSWNSNTLAIWCEELTHWKRPKCWERLKAKGEGSARGWDGWIASPTHWRHEFEQTPKYSEEQENQECYSPWGCQESDII